MSHTQEFFAALTVSTFGRRFALTAVDLGCPCRRGLDPILWQLCQFLKSRLSQSSQLSDGQHTPLKVHPLVVAWHVTATGCRCCLQKWDYIVAGAPLPRIEIEHVMAVVVVLMSALTRAASRTSQSQQSETWPGAEPL